MYERVSFRRKFFVVVGAAAGLVFGAVITWAALPNANASSPAGNFTTADKNPSHLVLHGVGFDKAGNLDDGSKAVLDYAAELLKQDPNATVSVDQPHEANPDGACGLTPAQTQTISSYVEARGVSANRIVLCQAEPSSPAPAQQ